MLSLETGLTALCSPAHYQTESLELGCLLDSLSDRPRMTELSAEEIQSHCHKHKDTLCLHLSCFKETLFPFPPDFCSIFFRYPS